MKEISIVGNEYKERIEKWLAGRIKDKDFDDLIDYIETAREIFKDLLAE